MTNGSVTSGAELDIEASDATSINADAGAAGILISLGKSSSSVAIGAAAAVTEDTRTIQASADGTALDAGGALNVTSTSSASITTWAMGIAAAISTGGGGGISFAGAGSGAGATIGQNVYAMITGGSVIATNALTVNATDETTIDTQAGGVSFVLARGPPNAVAIGLSAAANLVTDNVTAEISGASSVTAASLSITATQNAARVRSAASGSVITSAVYRMRPGCSATMIPAASARPGASPRRASPHVTTASAAPVKALNTGATCIPAPSNR